MIYLDTGFSLSAEASTDLFDIDLMVPRFIEKRFTGEVSSRLHDALSEAGRATGNLPS